MDRIDIHTKLFEIYEFFYFRWLQRKLKPSNTRNLTYCSKCGYCCHYSVCIPTPDELDRIADFLELDPIDLILQKFGFAHFHKEHYFFDPETNTKDDLCIIYPRPLTKSKLNRAGQVLEYSDFFDVKGCVFLTENNLCSIYPVRPKEAIDMQCWEQNNYSKPILSWIDSNRKLLLTTKYSIMVLDSPSKVELEFESQAPDFNDYEIIDGDYPDSSDREYTKNYSKLQEKLLRITKDKGGD